MGCRFVSLLVEFLVPSRTSRRVLKEILGDQQRWLPHVTRLLNMTDRGRMTVDKPWSVEYSLKALDDPVRCTRLRG